MDFIYTLPSFKVNEIGSVQSLSQIYPQNVRDFDFPNIWKKTRGKDVLVYVVDTGCPKDHKDLESNVDVSRCRSFVDGEDIYDTVNGHSTHCCGTIGATDNGFGTIGVAPEVTIVTGKVLNKHGSCTPKQLLNGLEYALTLRPDIINMSLGAEFPMIGLQRMLKKLTDENIIIVSSAGNNGENKVLYPAQHDECIAVGSYTDIIKRQRSEFSSWGDTLDIMAPGEEILSTYLNNKYAVLSGTSMAAPAVSGLIALLLSYYKAKGQKLTVDEVRKLLYTHAIDIGEVGRDQQFGWGIVNPETLFASNAYSKPVPVPKFTIRSFFKKLFGRS